MSIEQTLYTNSKLENLCGALTFPLRIRTISDDSASRAQQNMEDGVHILILNSAKIPSIDYEVYAGYHVGKILLPELRLETERLLLRRYQDGDAEQCFTFLSNSEDAYMDCCKPFEKMDEAYYERVALFAQRDTQYMVTLKESGEVIGTIHLFPDDSRAVDTMELGYSIARPYQRRGYAFEALSALLDLLQNGLHLEMVTAGILPENTASEKLLTKLGFRREGPRHKAVWHEGLDRPVDLVYYYSDRKESDHRWQYSKLNSPR